MIRTVLGLAGVAVTVGIISVNALIMLVSPKAWFRLPSWIAFRGTLTERQYGTGWGALQLRVGAALVLCVIIWSLYHAFLDL